MTLPAVRARLDKPSEARSYRRRWLRGKFRRAAGPIFRDIGHIVATATASQADESAAAKPMSRPAVKRLAPPLAHTGRTLAPGAA